MAEQNADKEYKQFFENIRGIAGHLQQLQQQALAEYKPLIENIVFHQSNDVNEIEHTLDGLLDIAANGEGLELYRKLCRYLYSINPESAAAYVGFWKEAWDEDEERFGQND